jgi:hypothetical protein
VQKEVEQARTLGLAAEPAGSAVAGLGESVRGRAQRRSRPGNERTNGS